MSRFYVYNRGLFFKYLMKTSIWRNKHFNGQLWQIKEEWIVGIRLSKKKWFDKDNVYYDGHTVDWITVFGIEFSKSYTYESKSLADWVEEEYTNE